MRVEGRKGGSQFGEAVNDRQRAKAAGYVSVSSSWGWSRTSWTRWQRRRAPRRRRRPRHRSSTSRPRTTRSRWPWTIPVTWTWWTDRIRGFLPTASSYNTIPISNRRTRIYGLMVRTISLSLPKYLTARVATVTLWNSSCFERIQLLLPISLLIFSLILKKVELRMMWVLIDFDDF